MHVWFLCAETEHRLEKKEQQLDKESGSLSGRMPGLVTSFAKMLQSKEEVGSGLTPPVQYFCIFPPLS